MVPLYDKTEIIGVVPYTANLDKVHKHDKYAEKLGEHMGLGKTRKGVYYVCYGSGYDSKMDYAKVITKEEAKRLALKYLLNEDTYQKLFGERYPSI